MKVTIEGMLCALGMAKPDRNKDQKFEAHQVVNIMQVDDNAKVDVVKVKCFDLTRKFEENKPVKLLCNLKEWQMGNRSGISWTVA